MKLPSHLNLEQNWIKINYDVRGTYSTNSLQVKIKLM